MQLLIGYTSSSASWAETAI